MVLLRFCVVAALAMVSTWSFAQAKITGLVDAPTAVQILEPHFATVEATLNSTSEKSTNYAYADARFQFTQAIYEDVQLGVDPAESLQSRMAAGFNLSPASATTTRDFQVAGGSNAGSLSGAQPVPTSTVTDPIVAELITLLTQ